MHEKKFNLAMLHDSITDGILRRIEEGCGNHGCVIRDPIVGTNGPCRCSPRDFVQTLRGIADWLEREYAGERFAHGRRWQ